MYKNRSPSSLSEDWGRVHRSKDHRPWTESSWPDRMTDSKAELQPQDPETNPPAQSNATRYTTPATARSSFGEHESPSPTISVLCRQFLQNVKVSQSCQCDIDIPLGASAEISSLALLISCSYNLEIHLQSLSLSIAQSTSSSNALSQRGRRSR